jgi:hypothetical protein
VNKCTQNCDWKTITNDPSCKHRDTQKCNVTTDVENAGHREIYNKELRTELGFYNNDNDDGDSHNDDDDDDDDKTACSAEKL